MNLVKKVLTNLKVNLQYKLTQVRDDLKDETDPKTIERLNKKAAKIAVDLQDVMKTLGTLFLIIYMSISCDAQNVYKAYLMRSGDTLIRLEIIDITIAHARAKANIIASEFKLRPVVRYFKKAKKNAKKIIKYV
jgi:hypothetical protein